MNRPISLKIPADPFEARFSRPRLPDPEVCPRCGSKDFVHILYGYPSPRARESAQAGEMALGGCSLRVGAPDWYCKACHHSFPREGGLPTDEEELAYRLRRERYFRRPDVVLLLRARRLREFLGGLIEKHVRVPALIWQEKPVLETVPLGGAYRYRVRFRSAIVDVSGMDELTHCTSRETAIEDLPCIVPGTPRTRRYEAAAIRLVSQSEKQITTHRR